MIQYAITGGRRHLFTKYGKMEVDYLQEICDSNPEYSGFIKECQEGICYEKTVIVASSTFTIRINLILLFVVRDMV